MNHSEVERQTHIAKLKKIATTTKLWMHFADLQQAETVNVHNTFSEKNRFYLTPKLFAFGRVISQIEYHEILDMISLDQNLDDIREGSRALYVRAETTMKYFDFFEKYYNGKELYYK